MTHLLSFQKIDTHYYDDKLEEVISDSCFMEELALVRGWGQEERKEKISALAQRLEKSFGSECREKEIALRFFWLIVSFWNAATFPFIASSASERLFSAFFRRV